MHQETKSYSDFFLKHQRWAFAVIVFSNRWRHFHKDLTFRLWGHSWLFGVLKNKYFSKLEFLALNFRFFAKKIKAWAKKYSAPFFSGRQKLLFLALKDFFSNLLFSSASFYICGIAPISSNAKWIPEQFFILSLSSSNFPQVYPNEILLFSHHVFMLDYVTRFTCRPNALWRKI